MLSSCLETNEYGRRTASCLRIRSALLVLAFVLGACGTGTRNQADGPLPSTSRVELELERSNVGPGESIDIRLSDSMDEPDSLVISNALLLKDGDSVLNQLVVRGLGLDEGPGVVPADAPVPLSGIAAGGPYRFDLPRLKSGTYIVCATYRDTSSASPRNGEACGTLTVGP